ncbi:MAG: SUMF1/EgtB/PvdO family nonheme iron enzyme, partial [Gammaproteobacteria bacterium]
LSGESLYVPGAAGSGKSTFCRWVTWLAAMGAMPEHRLPASEPYQEALPESLSGRLPVLVALRDFWSSMHCGAGVRTWTGTELQQALMDWLDHGRPGDLTGSVFSAHLMAGSLLLILDGVDEVPVSDGKGQTTRYPRETLLSGLADALPQWIDKGNRVLLTSRPYGLTTPVISRLGLGLAPLAALPEELQELFIRRWYAATDAERGSEKAEGLIDHLAGREDLAELTENPMLLTALCVRYGEGQRLPEDRYRLYDGLVNSILYHRFPDEKQRAPVGNRLTAIAHGMHTGDAVSEKRANPQAQVGHAEIERILQAFAKANPATERGMSDAATKRDELLSHSGLLLPQKGERAAFYHFSFQEFLAAEYLARSLDDAALLEVFKQRGVISEWRPTLLFLFSALAFRHRNPQWAVNRLTILAGHLDRRHVRANAAPAVLVAECLEIALNKGYSLDDLAASFKETCLAAIEDEASLPDRQRLGLVLGRLGDPRILDPRDPAGYICIPPDRYPYQQDARTELKEPIWLSRYPVTNSQFETFIEAGGYRAAAPGWSDEGRAWLREAKVSEPRYWRDQLFNAPNQPVVGVSWWEAEAFCRFVGGRLPTEREWEAAARGPGGYEYPWGGPWEDGICNTLEADLRVTSPVGLF